MMAGRPRKDTIDTHKLIISLAQAGMSNTQIAEVTGLARSTIQAWLSGTGLGQSVGATRAAMRTLESDEKARLNKTALQAARRLIRRHKVTETIERTDGDGNLLYTERRTRDADPNAGMVQFVLKNTDPLGWCDTPTPQVDGDGTDDDNEIRIEIVDGGNDG